MSGVAPVEDVPQSPGRVQPDLDQVDADRTARGAREPTRAGPESLEPAPVDALQRSEARTRASGLHLDAHELSPVPAAEVDLPRPGLEPPCEHAHPGPGQVPSRDLLAHAAEFARVQLEGAQQEARGEPRAQGEQQAAT